MRQYESPLCEVFPLETETDFLNGASAGGFPVDPVNPFGSNSDGIMEEDEDYE
jgi:hypothetical protein